MRGCADVLVQAVEPEGPQFRIDGLYIIYMPTPASAEMRLHGLGTDREFVGRDQMNRRCDLFTVSLCHPCAPYRPDQRSS
jgi:hypothetical protein